MGTTLDTTSFESLWRLRNLELLDLRRNNFNSSIMSSLRGLSSLRHLNLAWNKLSGSIDMEGDLEFLDLSGNFSNNSVFGSLNGLSHLKCLNLSGNQLTGSVHLKELAGLRNLVELQLNENNIEEIVGPQDKTILNKLKVLSLRINGKSLVLKSLGALSTLKIIDLAENILNETNPFQDLFNLSTLEELLLDGSILHKDFLQNHVESLTSLKVLDFLYHQFDLRYLSLSGSRFGGTFPNWLFENNTRLEKIYLVNNSFVGPFQLPSHPNLNLLLIDISHNKLEGHIPSNMSSIFPNLLFLNISKNSFVGTIPPSLGNIKSLRYLDFSDNEFSGEIKHHFANTPLRFIKLSNNNLSGSIPNMVDLVSLGFLLLDGNKFFGEIPDLSSLMNLETLDISRNSLSGRLPSWIANLSYLEEIDMSDNQFEGSIPLEFCRLHPLVFLDLSRNNLSGSIPPCFSELTNLKHVLLSRNKLRGPISHAFHNCTNLSILDLGGNNFNGTIPNWIGNFSSLSVLLLQANNFHENIPIELCQLRQLNVLAIFSNNLSGYLHACLSNFSSRVPLSVSYPEKSWIPSTFSVQDLKGFVSLNYILDFSIQEVVELTTKSISLNYKGYILDHMYGIDLSCNIFFGEIPIEFGNLSNVRLLNLSHNNLTGLIPTTFSNLKQLESLDLSYNKLNGQIPPQLIEVTSLEVFIVAHNNLSGPVPTKNQFGTFNESNYEGNPLLCGPSLKKKCNKANVAPPATYPFTEQSEDDSFMEMTDFWLSFVAAYTVILLGMATVVYINPYWRQAWFYHIGVCINSCYYFVVDKF